MKPDGIQVQQTYRTNAGKLVYVQDIYLHATPAFSERRVVYNEVGHLCSPGLYIDHVCNARG